MARSRDRRAGRPRPVAAETAAGTVEIVPDPQHAPGRLMLIGGLESAYVDLRDPTHLRLDYVRRMADALDALVPRGEPVEIVHLGGGGFTLPRQLAATRPAARQEVYELDPAIVALARRHLRLRRNSPALRVRVGDARALLERRDEDSADLVIGDAFTGTTVPAHLATSEFATQVRRVLRPGGRYLLNAIDAPPHAWARAQAATLRHGVRARRGVRRPRGRQRPARRQRALPGERRARPAAARPRPASQRRHRRPELRSGIAPVP